jgi:hypothetical protein
MWREAGAAVPLTTGIGGYGFRARAKKEARPGMTRVLCLTGKSVKPCLAQVAKIFRFAFDPNHFYKPCCLAPTQRGVSRSSRTSARDAMDAGLSKDERQASRTAKPYGPGAPTLASSLVELIRKATVANKPGHRGECEISRKTIACGNAGLIRWTCGDYARVLFIICTRGCGCIATRHSPRPQGAEVFAPTRTHRAAGMPSAVIARSASDEALAMTEA